jgi:hypothetical protein
MSAKGAKGDNVKKSEYVGPWPRKRHSHTCVTCKRKNNQGAVYCYKSKCKMPQSIENCTYCRPLTESPTYRPPQPQPEPQPEPIAIEVDVCIAGNSAVNGRCGDSECVCSPEGCEVCGCDPCSCDAPCEGCGRIVCECNAVKVAADRLGDGKGSDIRRSYSGDTIASAKSTIRAPFQHEGLLWCAVSLGMGLRAEAYRLTGAEHFADKRKKTTYNAKVLKDNGERRSQWLLSRSDGQA